MEKDGDMLGESTGFLNPVREKINGERD